MSASSRGPTRWQKHRLWKRAARLNQCPWCAWPLRQEFTTCGRGGFDADGTLKVKGSWVADNLVCTNPDCGSFCGRDRLTLRGFVRFNWEPWAVRYDRRRARKNREFWAGYP